MLQQPGCPNLYWALTSLPSPLISLAQGRDGERLWVLADLRDLDDSAPMSADQLQWFISHMDKLMNANPNRPGLRAWLDRMAKDEGTLSAARQRLIEGGFPDAGDPRLNLPWIPGGANIPRRCRASALRSI